ICSMLLNKAVAKHAGLDMGVSRGDVAPDHADAPVRLDKGAVQRKCRLAAERLFQATLQHADQAALGLRVTAKDIDADNRVVGLVLPGEDGLAGLAGIVSLPAL